MNMQYSAFSKTLLAIGLAPFFAHAVDSATETSQPIPLNGQYIVILKAPAKNSVMTLQGFNHMRADFVSTQALQISEQVGTPIKQKFTKLLNGFVVKASKSQAQQLAKQPNVKLVEPDYQVSVSPVSIEPAQYTQKNHVDWGLSRIDNHDLNLDGTYTYQYDGSGVTAYVVDTGINTLHQEFGGRATSINPLGEPAEDCMGHGTHVSGIIGGETTGVAKNVNLVGIKVLGCDGRGPNSQIIAGLEEVLTLAEQSGTPSVVNMSLGEPQVSQALESAVDNLINANVSVVVAAGNKNGFLDSLDACKGSPAHDSNTVTVSATDRSDDRASYSYYGQCTDIFAPGSDIISAWIGGEDKYAKASGTSMASPHVAGVVALYLQENSSLTAVQVKKELIDRSTSGDINMGGGFFSHRLASQSPNNLVYSLTN